MKTKEELIALKEEMEALNKKLAELTEDELEQVAAGRGMNEVEQWKARCKICFASAIVADLFCVGPEVRQQLERDMVNIINQLSPWLTPDIDPIKDEITPIKAQLTNISMIDASGIAKKCVDYLSEAEYWLEELRKKD